MKGPDYFKLHKINFSCIMKENYFLDSIGISLGVFLSDYYIIWIIKFLYLYNKSHNFHEKWH